MTVNKNPGNAFCQKLQSMLITWDRFRIQAAPCPLLPAQAPSLSVTVNKNPGGLPRNKKKLFVVACTLLHTHASLEGLSCLPPGTLRGSICDRVFL